MLNSCLHLTFFEVFARGSSVLGFKQREVSTPEFCLSFPSCISQFVSTGQPYQSWFIVTGRLKKKTWSQGLPAWHGNTSQPKNSRFIFAGIDYRGNKTAPAIFLFLTVWFTLLISDWLQARLLNTLPVGKRLLQDRRRELEAPMQRGKQRQRWLSKRQGHSFQWRMSAQTLWMLHCSQKGTEAELKGNNGAWKFPFPNYSFLEEYSSM